MNRTSIKPILLGFASLTLLLGGVGRAQAAFVTFTSNPSNNSGDWATSVTGLGGSINTNVNFNTMPTGALVNNFYTASDGVTFSTTGTTNSLAIQNTAGPADGNTSGSVPGEGLHAASNTLVETSSGGTTTLTISFNQAVLGAGLFIVDYFDNGSALTIRAFDGVNGTGTLLGTGTAVSQNFQNNHLYFMGVSDSTNVIRSIQIFHSGPPTGDTVGFDDIRFATAAQVSAVPAPAGAILFGLGLAGLVGFRALRRKPELAAAA